MGKIEKDVKSRDRKKNIQKALLGLIYVSGMLAVAAMAPNALRVFKDLGLVGQNKNRLKYSINQSFTRLKEKGLVEIVEHRGVKIARITEKGKLKLDFLQRHNFKIKKPKSWDGRWRIVSFDIKEKRKNTRNNLRATLFQIGFVKLQNSVWVYPYDCEDLISLLKSDLKVGKDILYIIAEKVENDWSLREHFKLLKSNGRTI